MRDKSPLLDKIESKLDSTIESFRESMFYLAYLTSNLIHHLTNYGPFENYSSWREGYSKH